MAKKTTHNNGRTADGRFKKGHTQGFKPGASGNPGGRPKTRHVSEAARNWFAAECAKAPHMTNAEALVEFLGAQALGGDVAAARELVDRAEGKAKQSVDLAVNDRRAMFERAIDALVEKQNVTRDEATSVMLDVMPEAKEWIN